MSTISGLLKSTALSVTINLSQYDITLADSSTISGLHDDDDNDDNTVSCRRPLLPGTSLESPVIPTKTAVLSVLCGDYYYYYYYYYYHQCKCQ